MKYSTELTLQSEAGTIPLSVNLRTGGCDLVLFLHGHGCTKECFDTAFQDDRLGQSTMCALDFPGHGDSPALPGIPHTLDTFAQITSDLIDLLAPRQVSIVGHSMGGAVGLLTTRTRDDVCRFVSIEGNLLPDDCGLVSRSTARQTASHFSTIGHEVFLDRLRRTPPGAARRWADWYERADPNALHENARSLVEWSDTGKLLELFNALPEKAYVHGDEDPVIRRVLPRLEDAVTRCIPNAGHFAMIDQPEAFYASLAELLTACEGFRGGNPGATQADKGDASEPRSAPRRHALT